MDYVALCYVRHKGKLYGHGEIINDLPEEAAERLLMKNAIQPIGGAEERPAPAPSAKKEKKGAEIPAAPVAEVEEAAEDDEDEAEIEIDAMDGIVTTPKEEEAAPVKPKRSTSRSKGGKAK